MLCSDSCGAETQEHIVTILCSFIQERPNQIGSGWKMLFGAIKAIRIGNIKERPNQIGSGWKMLFGAIKAIRIGNIKEKKKSKTSLSMVHFAVLEVLKKYFEIDDPKIFVPTALEFIFCVNHYLQSTIESGDIQSSDASVSQNEEREGAIAETILQFVEVCQKLFIEYFDSDDLPAFSPLINRLKLREKSIDFVEDNYDQRFFDLPPLSTILREEDQLGVFPADLNESIKKSIETFPWSALSPSKQTLSELILTLIESLAGLVLTCSRQVHSRLIAGLSDFISSFQANSIGADMGAFSL
uniref:Mon2/Sec7/BIG1-like HDS domain-containing protein n=1 Tax=Panagrolaimus sp. ES5 TaxID=591445 RepID=A0AC34FSK8_9BILA